MWIDIAFIILDVKFEILCLFMFGAYEICFA